MTEDELFAAYVAGFDCAVEEIRAGTASHVEAKQRDVYPDSQDCRIEFDRGYQHAVAAHMLGHNLEKMVQYGIRAASSKDEGAVIISLLDGTWHLPLRADPRRPPK